MKKSEFDARMGARWESGHGHGGKVDFIISARIGAESAGVVWDPEEEPLPERVDQYLRDGHHVVGPERDTNG